MTVVMDGPINLVYANLIEQESEGADYGSGFTFVYCLPRQYSKHRARPFYRSSRHRNQSGDNGLSECRSPLPISAVAR
jgi:hypothetical protein